jgi:putative endonuclease
MTYTKPTEYWRHRKGQHFEEAALRYLQQHGLQLVARNFRCKLGELDLIMIASSCLVFVEVRYRRNNHYGSAHGTVDLRKQTKLRNAARYFLLTNPQFANAPCRFDVVGLEGTHQQTQTIQWIQNAFY